MSRYLPILAVLVMAVALLLGWLFPSLPEEAAGVTRGRGAADRGATLRPGESASAAVGFLRTLRSDPPPPPAPIVIPPPPPPPPPDVSVVFKAALSAIERDTATGTYRALVRNSAPVGPQILTMAEGDRVGDGWTIASITENVVTLRKGRDVRVVRLYG